MVRGADRRSFLHALVSNDITGLGPGAGCYAALLTPQGRLIAELRAHPSDWRELGADVTIQGGPHVEFLRTGRPRAVRAEAKRHGTSLWDKLRGRHGS